MEPAVEMQPTSAAPSYESLRKTHANGNLSLALHQAIPPTFWLDCACSGGGYRAMIATTGLIAGLQECNLYQYICNMVGLSGSTWAIGPFMAKNRTIEDFTAQLKLLTTTRKFRKNLLPTLAQIARNVEQRFAQNRKVQFVDIYGGLIADRLMGDMGAFAQTTCLSDFAMPNMVELYPHPIFTFVHPHQEPGCCGCCKKTTYTWLEATPDMTRQVFSQHKIPTARLGLELRSPDLDRPLLPLSSIFGICGSAYACSARDLIAFLKNSLVEHFQKEARERASAYPNRGIILRELIETLKTGRLAPAKIPNFTDCDEDEIAVVDAGLHLNLPVIPLLERHSPCIIICDADSARETYKRRYPQLQKVAEWAFDHGLPFPSIKAEHAEEKNPSLLVFKKNNRGEVDHTLPTIIYFHNPVEKSTFEFDYTESEFDHIFGYMHHAVVSSAGDIMSEIREKIAFLQQ